MEGKLLEISWGSLWKIVAMAALVTALFLMRDVLVVVFIAIIISSAIYVPVSYLERKKIPRILSVLAIFFIGAAILGLILYTVVPVALIQLKYLLSNIQTLKVPFLETLFHFPDLMTRIDKGLSGIIDAVLSGGASVFKLVSSLVGNFFFILVSLVLSFYLSLSRDGVERFIRAIFPLHKEDYVVNLYIRTRKKLGRWLASQLVLSFLVGSLVFVGLVALGVEYALILALLAAVLELVPYVGPVIIGTITFLVTLPQSVSLAFLALIVFLAVQQIENHILVPFVMSKTIGIDPVIIVIAILAGSQIGGLAGIILAVPVTIVLQELIEDWSVKKQRLREVS